VIEQIFHLWTLATAPTAIISGAIFGLLVTHLRPFGTPYAATVLVATLFAFWLGPLMVVRLLDPAQFSNGLFTIGSYVTSLIFTASVGVSMAVAKRR
jgi:hypothetical protein